MKIQRRLAAGAMALVVFGAAVLVVARSNEPVPAVLDRSCVPDDAAIVIMLRGALRDTADLAFRPVFGDRTDPLWADLDQTVLDRFGFSLDDLSDGTAWAIGVDEALCFFSAGPPLAATAPETEIAGHAAVELYYGRYAMRTDGRLLMGTTAGLERVLARARGSEQAAIPESPAIGALGELMSRHTDAGVGIAVDLTPAQYQEDPIYRDAIALAIVVRGSSIVSEVRYVDEDAAARAHDSLNLLLAEIREQLAPELAAARAPGHIPDVVYGIVTDHLVLHVVDDMLRLDQVGDTLVASLDLGDLGTLVSRYSGIVAAFKIPEYFLGFVKRATTAEASRSLQRLVDGSAAAFETSGTSFPPSVARTPTTVPCRSAAAPNPADWEHPTWRSLGFEVLDRHYYSYQYDSSGSGPTATFTASAFGDLDCDDVHSTWVRFGWVEDGEVRGPSGIYISREME